MRKLTLKESQLENISYHKVEVRGKQVIHGEYKPRVVIPTYVPAPKHANVKAIDVTDLPEEQQEAMLEAWNEYQDYLEQQRKTLFAFEDFVQHTGRDLPDVKWRTFKPENIA